MNIQLPVQTVVLLVGPSNCGKSVFAKSMARAYSKQGYTSRVVSSDDLRRFILDEPTLDKMTNRIMEASESAFKLLESHLRAFITYPCLTDYVIVDTTGLDEKFRDSIVNIAEGQEYNIACVLFDYKDKKEYFYGVDRDSIQDKVTYKGVERFRKDVLPNISSRKYDSIIRIRKRDFNEFEDYEFTSSNGEDLKRNMLHLKEDQRLAVIGDVHECYEEFIELISKLEENDVAVLVGDYLDKGGNTRETIAAVNAFVKNGGIVIRGNHESYVAGVLKGTIDYSKELADSYFNSLHTLLKDEVLKETFLNIWDNSHEFLKVTSDNFLSRTIYVSHAPCKNVFLGKIKDFAVRAQRNIRYGHTKEEIENNLAFIKEESRSNFPVHVFGHVAIGDKDLNIKNQHFVDTGCVYGGNLTAMIYHGNKVFPIQVPSKKAAQEKSDSNDGILTGITTRFDRFSAVKIEDLNLDDKELRFCKALPKKGIKYISGTMSPAPSTSTELEPLTAAFDYFKKLQVNKVIIEPKYMGSRCQAYLNFNEPEQSYAVSRGGYIIREDQVEGLQNLLTQKANEYKLKMPEASNVITDGELLPWSALGGYLIEKDFKPYYEVVSDELTELSNDETFKVLFPDYELEKRKELIEVFNTTLTTFSKNEDLFYKPFDILSVDGKPFMENNEVSFNTFNSDEYLVVELDNLEQIQKALEFFKHLTFELGMEGVVVKPYEKEIEGLPYMKVRNENYLTLIYGYDYSLRYESLCRQKNISHKVKVSQKEHELSMAMLTADDDTLVLLGAKMVGELNKEKELDPRL